MLLSLKSMNVILCKKIVSRSIVFSNNRYFTYNIYWLWVWVSLRNRHFLIQQIMFILYEVYWKMYKSLFFLRLFGSFPRHLKISKENGRVLVGCLSMPLMLYSLFFMTLRITLMMNETVIQRITIIKQSSYNFVQLLRIYLWILSCISTQIVQCGPFVSSTRNFVALFIWSANFNRLSEWFHSQAINW